MTVNGLYTVSEEYCEHLSLLVDMLVVASDKFKAHEVETNLMFPKDRLSQSYEQYVVNLKTDATTYHMMPQLQEDIQYCMVALEHLNVRIDIAPCNIFAP